MSSYWRAGIKPSPTLFLNSNGIFCRGGVYPRPQTAIEYVIEFMNQHT